jgi:hypothetical protein
MHPERSTGKSKRPLGGRVVPGGDDKAALIKIELDSGVCIDDLDIRDDEVGDPGIDVDRGVVNEASDTPSIRQPTLRCGVG